MAKIDPKVLPVVTMYYMLHFQLTTQNFKRYFKRLTGSVTGRLTQRTQCLFLWLIIASFKPMYSNLTCEIWGLPFFSRHCSVSINCSDYSRCLRLKSGVQGRASIALVKQEHPSLRVNLKFSEGASLNEQSTLLRVSSQRDMSLCQLFVNV